MAMTPETTDDRYEITVMYDSVKQAWFGWIKDLATNRGVYITDLISAPKTGPDAVVARAEAARLCQERIDAKWNR
jgi:hypothetical protein